MELSMVGKRVREYRLENKLTQVELSEKTGISESMIYAIETGKRAPGVETLILLSKALNVSVEALLADYVDDQTTVRGNGILSKVGRLPKNEQDRILKIMDALVAAAS